MAQVDQETKAKAGYDKMIKQYEMQLAEFNVRVNQKPQKQPFPYRQKQTSRTAN
jgi:hypothetical protein